MEALVFTLLLILLLVEGVPVGFSMAITGALGLYYKGGLVMVLGILQTSPLTTVSSYELITVPMFLLMAEFVVLSGIADDLFDMATIWVGRIPGGLGVATTIAGAGFGAISGSSTAAAATLSATSIPAMIKQGYEPKMTYGVVAISGTLAMLIPPSIAIVLYGIIANQSIGQMLIAGVIPGLLITLTIIATIVILVFMDKSRAPIGAKYTLKEKIASLKVTGPLLILILLVTGIIYLGVATPTEAAGLGAGGAFLLACRARKINMSSLRHALVRATRTSCMIMMIILGALIFGYFFTLTQATQDLVAWIASLHVNRYLILIMVLFMYMILGCLMDQVAILILTVPVVLPVMKALGFDPVWFGILIIIMAELGMVTPPVGLNVYVVARCTNRPVDEIFRGVVPHVVAHIIAVIILVVFPWTVLWLPSAMSMNP